ncbi:MAG: hypothetical protein K2M47_07255 [Clostridiales bacterium]|nr:hypothetical protein [Clostridiales bacterium]
MDKITTALTATEDNAAAIRALGNKLREQMESSDTATAAIEALREQVAKTEADVDDLREQIINSGGGSGSSSSSHRFIVGTASGGSVTFGKVKSDGNVCAIVIFDSTAKRPVVYNNKSLGTVTSPAMLLLPEGNAELFVSTVTSASVLLVHLTS